MTGFDVPSCSTIYLDKPLRNHTLMQTIARANRVFGDKVNGLIVDYVGVFRDLQKALAIYAGGGTGGGRTPVQEKKALIAMLQKAIAEVADACIDRFFICDTWHHIGDHAHYLALMKKMLKPRGQVVMIDFKKAQTPVGPPMEMRISRDDLLKEMEANGFKLTTEHTFLPHQYFLVFSVR